MQNPEIKIKGKIGIRTFKVGEPMYLATVRDENNPRSLSGYIYIPSEFAEFEEVEVIIRGVKQDA
jgi:hypothetical protein